AVLVDSVITEPVVSLYPNPAIKFINIESNNLSDVIGKMATIYNVYGGVVISQLLMTQKTAITIQHLPAGVYFLKIGKAKANKSIRFVKG
ncbi:MAG: T9SS type A sorting domain-containing protein, partial [Chitinophagaceae bacterium]